MEPCMNARCHDAANIRTLGQLFNRRCGDGINATKMLQQFASSASAYMQDPEAKNQSIRVLLFTSFDSFQVVVDAHCADALQSG